MLNSTLPLTRASWLRWLTRFDPFGQDRRNQA
jgi:hypothetical protein